MILFRFRIPTIMCNCDRFIVRIPPDQEIEEYEEYNGWKFAIRNVIFDLLIILSLIYFLVRSLTLSENRIIKETNPC